SDSLESAFAVFSTTLFDELRCVPVRRRSRLGPSASTRRFTHVMNCSAGLGLFASLKNHPVVSRGTSACKLRKYEPRRKAFTCRCTIVSLSSETRGTKIGVLKGQRGFRNTASPCGSDLHSVRLAIVDSFRRQARPAR